MHETNTLNKISSQAETIHPKANRPKILIALFRLPYPATDGTRYKILYNLVSGLKRSFDVEFFVVQIKEYSPEDVAFIEREFGKVHLFYHSKIAFAANGLRALVTGLPVQAQAFHFDDAQKWLDAHIDEYDAVYVHEIRMTEFFIRYSDERKQKFLVDFNDAISMNYRDGVHHMTWYKQLFYKFEGSRVTRYESVVLKTFTHFSVVSERDREYLITHAGLTTAYESGLLDFTVTHHGVPLQEGLATRNRNQLFFIGSLDYAPNREALNWLLMQLWPIAAKELPNYQLLIVGGGSIDPAWRSVPQVTFTGFVPEVFPVIAGCRALVAPIAYAGGTPSKIIEAMGYGIPVITTVEGAQGITGASNGAHVMLAPKHEPQAWVTALKQLLGDQQLQDNLARAGRALVEAEYSQTAAENTFHDRFQKIITASNTSNH